MAGVFLCDRIIADAPGAFAYSPRLCGLDTRPRAHLSPTRVDILFIRYITEYFPCEFFSMAEECRRPVHRGRLRRRARVGAGCGVLRAWLVTTPREAPETRPPPLRADARSSQTVKPSCFIPRRTGAHKSLRWSAERRASRVMGRKAPAGACGPPSLARRRVPLHPSACRRSASLFV